MRKKTVAIGIENYKRMIDDHCYYVDKTLLIKDLVDSKGGVILFTRPRRFGKTLALSMVKTFFEQELDEEGTVIENNRYFTGMKIMEAGERYTGHMGRYPVISLSLKSAKQPNYQMAYKCMLDEIVKVYEEHRYVLKGETLLPSQKERYRAMMEYRADESQIATALKFLADCLKKYHKQNVIILVDEYDVPLENSYFKGFYEQMIDFLRSLFESALKTNDSLEFAVITGCLRISRESIFTGLNNLEINSVLNVDYAEYFGFTQDEVSRLLSEYDLSSKESETKKWYDGYLFGNTHVYNPWSIINYVKNNIVDKNAFPKPYWSNTSSNSIIRELVEYADAGAKKEIEDLIAGKTITKPVYEDITYGDIRKSQDNLWNFLFFTGYLKMKEKFFRTNTTYVSLEIPNEEVRYIYQNTIREWFQTRLKQTDFAEFYQAVLDGNEEKTEAFLSGQLAGSISYYDSQENFYHGYLVGILSGLDGYEINSNQESGTGRPDILLKPFSPRRPAVILELKKAGKFPEMKKKCEEALTQIEEKQYAASLIEEGYEEIIKYGICFCKKTCMVKAVK